MKSNRGQVGFVAFVDGGRDSGQFTFGAEGAIRHHSGRRSLVELVGLTILFYILDLIYFGKIGFQPFH